MRFLTSVGSRVLRSYDPPAVISTSIARAVNRPAPPKALKPMRLWREISHGRPGCLFLTPVKSGPLKNIVTMSILLYLPPTYYPSMNAKAFKYIGKDVHTVSSNLKPPKTIRKRSTDRRIGPTQYPRGFFSCAECQSVCAAKAVAR